jgi:hypothetical protein
VINDEDLVTLDQAVVAAGNDYATWTRTNEADIAPIAA